MKDGDVAGQRTVEDGHDGLKSAARKLKVLRGAALTDPLLFLTQGLS